jgi:hypothetical protein
MGLLEAGSLFSFTVGHCLLEVLILPIFPRSHPRSLNQYIQQSNVHRWLRPSSLASSVVSSINSTHEFSPLWSFVTSVISEIDDFSTCSAFF